MNRTKIHINQIAIRMQGVDPALTESLGMRMSQSVATELGSALLNALSQQPELRRVLQISNLTVEPIQVEVAGGDRHPSQQLSQTIAQAVSQAILASTPATPTNLNPSVIRSVEPHPHSSSLQKQP